MMAPVGPDPEPVTIVLSQFQARAFREFLNRYAYRAASYNGICRAVLEQLNRQV